MVGRDNTSEDESYIDDVFSSIFHNTQNDIKENDCCEADSIDEYIFSSDLKQDDPSFIEEEISELENTCYYLKEENRAHTGIKSQTNLSAVRNWDLVNENYENIVENSCHSKKIETVTPCPRNKHVNETYERSCVEQNNYTSDFQDREESFFEEDLSSTVYDSFHSTDNRLNVRKITEQTNVGSSNYKNEKFEIYDTTDMKADQREIGVDLDKKRAICIEHRYYKDVNTPLGFTTGINKAIAINNDSYLKAERIEKSVIEDLSYNPRQSNRINDSTNGNKKEIITGFTTGNNKAITINNDSLLKAERIEKSVIEDTIYNPIKSNTINDLTKETKKEIITGFTTGNNKAITINNDSLLKAERIEKSVIEDTIYESRSDFTEKNIITSTITDDNRTDKLIKGSVYDHNTIVRDNKSGHNTADEYLNTNYKAALEEDGENFSDSSGNCKHKKKVDTSDDGLKDDTVNSTCNNIDVHNSLHSDKQKKPCITKLPSCTIKAEAEENGLESFFKKRKKEASLPRVNSDPKKDFTLKTKNVQTPPESSHLTDQAKETIDAHYKKFYRENRTMRSYLKPETGHVTTEINYILDCQNIYDNIKKKYPEVESERFRQHFKWAWISSFVNRKNKNMNENLENEVSKRIKKEYSVLRRITEGDDIPQKYICVLVISAKDKEIEVFDGFFSVKCIIDNDLQRNVISQKIKFGTYLLVANAELLIENKEFFAAKCQILKLFYNSTKIGNPKKLGYQSKIGFCTYIKKITKTGGTISGLELKIEKIIETKITIKVGNYVNTVDESSLENELEKIENMIRSSKSEESYKPLIIRYTKLSCTDKYNQICLLTWNDCGEIRNNEIFRFLNLRIVQKSTGLHFITHKQTHIKKIDIMR